MRRSSLVLIAFFCVGACCASAQQILPPSFGPWQSTWSPGPTHAADLAALGPAPQGILDEYGVVSSQLATYSHEGRSGAPTLQVAVFQLKDPTGAYGLYSYLRVPGMAPAEWSEHSSMSRERALILLGNMVLDLRGPELSSARADLKTLVDAVKPHAQSGALPTLWQSLPTKGMLEGTDRYVLGVQTVNQLFPVPLGNSLRFSAGAEAEMARYRVGGRDAVLLIADYPTPQVAAHVLADLQMNFEVNGSKPGAGASPLFAKRSLTLLAIVSGPANQTEAATLLNQVRSATELTWNEPTFRFKEPGIEVMILGTILGTVFICALMVIASLTFGGLRLLVKRALPNRIFDRTSELQILQLGLSSKPINAEDFYSLGGPRAPKVYVDKNLPDRIALRIFR